MKLLMTMTVGDVLQKGDDTQLINHTSLVLNNFFSVYF